VQLNANGSSPALLISLAFHALAVVGAGMQRHRPTTMRAATPLEISVESEAAALSPPIPTPEPAPNEAAAPTPLRAAAVHHEPVAIRAVAATEPKAAAQPAPAEAPPAFASDAELPRFSIATSIAAALGANLAKASGTATALQGAPDGILPYAEDAVDVRARALKKVSPRYPLQAQSNGAEATVKMEIVLSSIGVVESVRALNHPGQGFEEEAIAAARRTPFTPAMKRGRAVAVRMAWTVEFRLQ
jgi:TonB family protein